MCNATNQLRACYSCRGRASIILSISLYTRHFLTYCYFLHFGALPSSQGWTFPEHCNHEWGQRWRGSLREHAAKVSIFHSLRWSWWLRRQIQENWEKLKEARRQLLRVAREQKYFSETQKRKQDRWRKRAVGKLSKILFERENNSHEQSINCFQLFSFYYPRLDSI